MEDDQCFALVEEIHRLSKCFKSCFFVHVMREAMQWPADKFAKFTSMLDFGMVQLMGGDQLDIIIYKF